MKTKHQLIILILILCYSNGFSQKDSLSVVDKKEVKNFHEKIFKLSVDTTIDSSTVYKLLYTSEKGWVQGSNYCTNHKKKYHSEYFIAFNPKIISLAEILPPPESSKDLTSFDSLFLDQTTVNVSNESISPLLEDYIIHSRQDAYFKELKNKTFDTQIMKVIILLGGKYLLVASKFEYIGNSSFSTVNYHYYEKIK